MRNRKAVGITAPPPAPDAARPMPGTPGGRYNRQDRMRYAELSKGDGRINRQDRRFMKGYENRGQPPMPQRPQPGGNMGAPLQRPQQPPMAPPSQGGQVARPMPNNIQDYYASTEPVPSRFNGAGMGNLMGMQNGFGQQMGGMMGGFGGWGGYGQPQTQWNPMSMWQQYRNGGGNGQGW